MKYRRYIQIGWIFLLALLVSALVVTPASAASRTMRQTMQHTTLSQNSTPLNATIYLTMGTLTPIFQGRINQQVPSAVSSAIANIVSKLPLTDRGWASTMAATVIQPSAVLTGLTPQQGGLLASVRLSLYPGDPQPINAMMLVKFSVLDSSTVQVSIQPMPGSPSLVNGPIATFQVPIGQLSNINATPNCGDSALAVNLQVPVSLGQAQSAAQNSMQGQQTSGGIGEADMQQPAEQQVGEATGGNVNSYVEIPATSLASLGNSISSLPISSSLSAQNIQIAVGGGNLVINSDIMLNNSFQLGTAVTTVEPTAANGGLAVHVLSTTLTVLQIFTFPYDTYNAQIEQTLNAKLGNALAGKFNISSAAIGANSHVPCAASDSLILTGTTSLG